MRSDDRRSDRIEPPPPVAWWIRATFIAMMLFTVGVGGPSAANAAEFGYGARAGATLSNFSGDLDTDSSFHAGFAAYVVAEFFTLPFLGLQAELGYVEKGETRSIVSLAGEQAEEAADLLGGGDDVDTVLRYLEVPVLVRVGLPGPISPYVIGGGYAGFLLDAQSSAGGNDFDADDSFEPIDLGMQLGAGVLLDIPLVSLDAQLRWSRGIVPAQASDAELGNDGKDLFNQTLMLSVGLGF